ncbi:MAG: hypothetical protein H0Z37_09220 [Firmicutes bacterium]|nr:hypothetical protein [Bacillota bacterium]
MRWRGPWGGWLHFVESVPLRDEAGPLLSAQIVAPNPLPRITWIAYGTPSLRHQFFVADGTALFGRHLRLSWGRGWQAGAELASTGEPAIVSVAEWARFARIETGFGRHRIWFSVHGTSPGFRSLANPDYPFRRGRTGIEGRWQFRPATGHLLSVFGRYTSPLSSGSEELDGLLSYSAAPRGRWAWRVDVEWRRREGEGRLHSWEIQARDPERRLELSAKVYPGESPLRVRPAFEWAGSGWRLRVTADTGFPGWRMEWRLLDHPAWQVTAVYKVRGEAGDDGQGRTWSHVSVAHRVPGFGSVWVKWGRWDQGRLDVGWSWPAEAALGLSVDF